MTEPTPEAAELRQALDLLPVGLSVFGPDDRLQLGNRTYAELYGLPAALTQPGTPFPQIIAATPGSETEWSKAQLRPAAGTAGVRWREWRMHDGRLIRITVRYATDGSACAVHEDITDKRAAEERIAHLAWHDALTGLANRRRLAEEMPRLVARAAGGEGLALLLLDLDHFRRVNDSHGHGTGDAALVEVAHRLQRSVRGGDFVVRLGGDEFGVVQCGPAQPAAAAALAARLLRSLAEPWVHAGHRIDLGASIGVAVLPYDGDTLEIAQSRADQALEVAKGAGRGTFRFFEPSMERQARERRTLECELRSAVAAGSFELAFQPQVRLDSRQIVGFEALLRWNHPTLGAVPPARFIEVAEACGLIEAVGRWVLDAACREAAAWPVPWRVAVNVSPIQLRAGSLVPDVAQALAASGLPPGRLELEITESALLHDVDHVAAMLRSLRELGVVLALDDFGTGYSSLGLLTRLRFDHLKIDRSFVAAAADDSSRGILRAIVALARSQGMRTTAEGIETDEQWQLALAEGCDEGQGWLFGHPGPVQPPAAALPPPVSVASGRAVGTLERLVYVSRARDELGDEEVYDIVRAAHNRNRRDGLTGVLLYIDGWFLQVLEGDPHLLARRFEVIAADPRHRDIEVRAREAIRERSFGNEWLALGTGAEIETGLLESAGYEPGFPADRFDTDTLVHFALRCVRERVRLTHPMALA